MAKCAHCGFWTRKYELLCDACSRKAQRMAAEKRDAAKKAAGNGS